MEMVGTCAKKWKDQTYKSSRLMGSWRNKKGVGGKKTWMRTTQREREKKRLSITWSNATTVVRLDKDGDDLWIAQFSRRIEGTLKDNKLKHFLLKKYATHFFKVQIKIYSQVIHCWFKKIQDKRFSFCLEKIYTTRYGV